MSFSPPRLAIAFGLIAIAALLILLASYQTLDLVSNQYPTRAEAEADHLFQRGWLPSIIPPSATKITTHNNLDLNTSNGSFSFPANEHEDFLKLLQPTENPNEYRYQQWIFRFANKLNHCRYRLQAP